MRKQCQDSAPFSEDMLLSRLLYKDSMMLIINKPSGIPVHAGPKGGPNLEQYFDVLRFGWKKMPALAHRLDRDTSGCLILGRHRKALRRLGACFTNGNIKKTYWAMVEGCPSKKEGVINLSLRKKITDKRSWRIEVAKQNGQESITHYKLLGSNGKVSWLELSPKTGRTHQLRVHCAAMGWPIIGDPLYGNGAPDEKMQLHARSIQVPLYSDKPPIYVEAAPPDHMQELISRYFLPTDKQA